MTAGFLAVSCTTEITLKVNKDNSVDVNFEGGAGEAFTKMILSASGAVSGNSSEVDLGIDTKEISYELAKAGFDNVRAESNKNLIKISMTDKKRTSYIFKSDIVKDNDGKLELNLTRKSLEDFYNSSDEQTRMILDLFLAPAFNDEEMTTAEYLEMLASFYGNAAAKEVEESFVKINIVQKDGSKKTQKIGLAELLCANFY